MHMPAAPVVDSRLHFVGMLTEKDCIRVVSVSAFHRPRGGKVSDFLSPVAQVLRADMDLFRVSELFLSCNFPMLPVVEGEKLVGCISRQNMLNGIMEMTRARQAEDEELERIEGKSAEAVERPRSIEDMQKTFASHSREQLVGRLGRKT